MGNVLRGPSVLDSCALIRRCLVCHAHITFVKSPYHSLTASSLEANLTKENSKFQPLGDYLKTKRVIQSLIFRRCRDHTKIRLFLSPLITSLTSSLFVIIIIIIRNSASLFHQLEWLSSGGRGKFRSLKG